ncbi:hypothetical protein L9F63_021961, partial [Diploptera punctata]
MTNPTASTLVFAVLVSWVLADIDLKASVDKCGQNIGISDAGSLMAPNTMILKDESNENGRCFVECLMSEFGI